MQPGPELSTPIDPAYTKRCALCGSGSPVRARSATEMMYGMGGSFDYLECGLCGSLTLGEPPPRLADFYPPGYYSFASSAGATTAAGGVVGRAVRRSLLRFTLASPLAHDLVMTGAGRLGRSIPAWTSLLSGLGLGLEAAVLDVGCGDGHRLHTLRRHGFTNLTGTDPHLPAEADGQGVRFWRGPLDDLPGPFDLVMFHHSFEHTTGPEAVLGTVHRLLAPAGALIIRLPVAGSYAWRTYEADWVQLDAPRHQFLPSVAGLHLLAARTGFSVARTLFDSEGLQFWGSEQYRLGIPLFPDGPNAAAPTPRFTPTQLAEFERRAEELNALGEGDQAGFLLRKASPGPPARPSW